MPVMGGFIGANDARHHHDHRPRRLRFFRRHLRRRTQRQRIEIWTDVDGMMTTDPRICPDARRIKVISFDEAAELAYFGAKVLHPATVLPAVQQNIPVCVLNSRNPTCEGTQIIARAPHCKNIFKAIAAKKKHHHRRSGRAAHAAGPRIPASPSSTLRPARVAVDVVSTSEVSVSLTVDSNEAIPR